MIDKIYRTFISIPVSKEIMSKKTMLYSTIDSAKGNINWVRNNHLHLTIKYLGNTPESEFEKVMRVSNLQLTRFLLSNSGLKKPVVFRHQKDLVFYGWEWEVL